MQSTWSRRLDRSAILRAIVRIRGDRARLEPTDVPLESRYGVNLTLGGIIRGHAETIVRVYRHVAQGELRARLTLEDGMNHESTNAQNRPRPSRRIGRLLVAAIGFGVLFGLRDLSPSLLVRAVLAAAAFAWLSWIALSPARRRSGSCG